MKRIIIVILLMIFGLFVYANTAKNEDEQPLFIFDGEDFEFSETNDDGTLVYVSPSYEMVIKPGEESILITFEKDEDIYIVSSNYTTMNIRLNGSITSICTLSTEVCSGSSLTGYEEDLYTIIELFETEYPFE